MVSLNENTPINEDKKRVGVLGFYSHLFAIKLLIFQVCYIKRTIYCY